jgi:DNA invertase Pin-like site-specific DNA recombinase
MIGAAIYVRVSSKEQTENLSLPTQPRACEDCRREGFEILERFKEEGESAKTTDRTELQKLHHHAEAIEELDVQGILAFAERVLPRAADLWVQPL